MSLLQHASTHNATQRAVFNDHLPGFTPQRLHVAQLAHHVVPQNAVHERVAVLQNALLPNSLLLLQSRREIVTASETVELTAAEVPLVHAAVLLVLDSEENAEAVVHNFALLFVEAKLAAVHERGVFGVLRVQRHSVPLIEHAAGIHGLSVFVHPFSRQLTVFEFEHMAVPGHFL